MCVNFFNAH